MVFPTMDDGGGAPLPGGSERWDPLVRRILEAAGPELARLQRAWTLVGQYDEWTRPLLPLAALLMLIFGSLLAWTGAESRDTATEVPLLAEVLVPEPVGLWLEAGVQMTLAELVTALEEAER